MARVSALSSHPNIGQNDARPKTPRFCRICHRHNMSATQAMYYSSEKNVRATRSTSI